MRRKGPETRIPRIPNVSEVTKDLVFKRPEFCQVSLQRKYRLRLAKHDLRQTGIAEAVW